MMSEQLELFPGTDANAAGPAPVAAGPTVTGPAGEAVPFPADRQIAHVRRVARALDARDEWLAGKYWRTECNRLIGRLQVQGFAMEIIRAEVIRFANAVARHRSAGQQQPPGAA